MITITLNTGQSDTIPTDLVKPPTREILLPLIRRGSGSLPGAASAYSFRLFLDPYPLWTYYRGASMPLTSSALALDPNQAGLAWRALENLYFKTAGDLTKSTGGEGFGSTICEMPTSLPWMATVLLAPMLALAPRDAGFIGHMSICFAELIREELSRG